MLSVIIPCRNEVTRIASVLNCLLTQKMPEGGLEILVADGMSSDGTQDVVRQVAARDDRVRLLQNTRQFAASGLNLGIREARGRFIARIDAHSSYASDYLYECMAVLRSTGADNVGGPWIACGEGYISRAIAAAFQSPFAVGGARSHTAVYEGPVDSVYLGCWPKTTFEKYGDFDEDLVRNQDDEHNFRINRGGGTVWQSPRIRSWYSPRNSIKALFRQYYQYGYWKVRVIQKHGRPACVRHVVPGLFLGGLVVCSGVGFFLPVLWALGGIALIAYIVGLSVAAIDTARLNEWRLLPVLPLVFATYHMGFGIGFLNGILDFVLLKRAPKQSATILTRNTQEMPDAHIP